MARIRTIKPEFFTSLTIADLSLTARLTFIGLWTHVDDDGRCVDEPRLVRAAVWPLDDRTAADVEVDLRTLHDASLIHRYERSGRRFLAIRNWREHQRIDKPKPSKLPAPEDGTPTPPEPHSTTTDEAPTSEDDDFPDVSWTDPGRIRDTSETAPGSVPVGKEQGTGKGREREGKGEGCAQRDQPQVVGAEPERPDGLPLTPIDTDGFELTDAMRAWSLRTFGAGLDVDYETAQFVDHFRGQGVRRPNWPTEWQKWIRRSAKYASERANRPPLRSVGSTGSRAQTHTADDYKNSSVEDLFAS